MSPIFLPLPAVDPSRGVYLGASRFGNPAGQWGSYWQII